MKMNWSTTVIALAALTACFLPLSASTIVVNTTKAGDAPTVLNNDLGQTAFGSISNVSGLQSGSFDDLFDGSVGGITGVDMKARFNANAAFTLNFDLTDNPDGFDIASITTVAGWDVAGGGRSNQGYGIELFFAAGGSGILLPQTTWEPNDPAEVWTSVTFTNDGGGALDNGTISATGVSAIRFFGFDGANAGGGGGGRTNWHEIDIVAVPEPAAFALLGGGLVFGLALIRRRRR